MNLKTTLLIGMLAFSTFSSAQEERSKITFCYVPEDWMDWAYENDFQFIKIDMVEELDFVVITRYANPRTLEFVEFYTDDFGRYCVHNTNSEQFEAEKEV